MYQTYLQSADFAVKPFSDGRQCWAWLSTHPKPALLITDLEMPGLTGLALVETIRHDPILKKLPVVVLTNTAEQKHRRQAYQLKVAVFLSKMEVSLEQLAWVVKKILRGKGVVTSSTTHPSMQGRIQPVSSDN